MATSALIKRLDIEFSKFVRQVYCSGGKGFCISCKKPITFETCDAGHFIPRTHMATRFDERNVNAQCRHCNRCLDGNEVEYEKGLLRLYGEDIVEELHQLRNTTHKYSDSDIKELIKEYKKRTEELINT